MSNEKQKIIDQLREEGYDVDEYDAENVGDQGEAEGH